jgi:hypothetical protein
MGLLDSIASWLGYEKKKPARVPQYVDVCIDGSSQRIEGEMTEWNFDRLAQQWAEKIERCAISIVVSGVKTYMTLDLTNVTSMVATPKVESNEPS